MSKYEGIQNTNHSCNIIHIYTLFFRLYFRICICLNKLSINHNGDIK